MELLQKKENTTIFAWNTIEVVENLNPNKEIKEKSSIFYPFWEKSPIYIHTISLRNVIAIKEKIVKE